ncbi:MAG: hypothetical protein KF729_27495 [Sandaracinaceae bacterium]|nr:hypothetical protein [Sandaracinaceae bacterium]
MRWWLVALAALLVGGCDGGGGGTDAGGGHDAGGARAAHARASWRMRCASGECPAVETPARTIDHDHLQDGHEVRCDLPLEGATRRMDITARSPDGYGFEVRGATIGADGGRIMGSLCQIRIFEPGDVDLLTTCTSSSPAPGTACQLSRIMIRSVDGVPTLSADLRCDDAPADGRPSELRDVTSPTSAGASAELAFTGCTGL